jgi:hypothetical protein
MAKIIHLANVTVEVTGKSKSKSETFCKVSYVEGQETYKNKKIISVEILGVIGKTNY